MMFCDDDMKTDYDIHKQKFEIPMTYEEYYGYRMELINKYDIYEDHTLYGGVSNDYVY